MLKERENQWSCIRFYPLSLQLNWNAELMISLNGKHNLFHYNILMNRSYPIELLLFCISLLIKSMSIFSLCKSHNLLRCALPKFWKTEKPFFCGFQGHTILILVFRSPPSLCSTCTLKNNLTSFYLKSRRAPVVDEWPAHNCTKESGVSAAPVYSINPPLWCFR